MSRIYLDNAATSFPKPEQVYAAVERYQRELGVSVGRGASRAGSEVQRTIDACRRSATQFFGIQNPDHVIFTLNGTDSLNLAIQGLLRPGDRVIASVWDHNSVLRPIQELQKRGDITSDIIGADSTGRIDLESLEKSLRIPTKLVVVTHASNVTGIIQPVSEVVQLARNRGALVLLDAAQTAGHVPIQMKELEVDLIACPGHKGLLGPLGTGLLILGEGVADQLQPVRFGGTGTSSESDRQPDRLPERFESGNLNAPGLFGLAAAFDWHRQPKEKGREAALTRQLISGLQTLPRVQVYLGDEHLPRVGVISCSLEGVAPHVAAALLDEHFGIETRAGLHCAPRAHEALGTLKDGGTLRFSVGPFTTPEEVDQTLEAMAQIAVAL